MTRAAWIGHRCGHDCSRPILRYTAESFNVGPWLFKVWQQGHLYPVASVTIDWQESFQASDLLPVSTRYGAAELAKTGGKA